MLKSIKQSSVDEQKAATDQENSNIKSYDSATWLCQLVGTE